MEQKYRPLPPSPCEHGPVEGSDSSAAWVLTWRCVGSPLHKLTALVVAERCGAGWCKPTTVAELAEIIEGDEPDVHEALRDLISMNVLRSASRSGGLYSFYVNLEGVNSLQTITEDAPCYHPYSLNPPPPFSDYDRQRDPDPPPRPGVLPITRWSYDYTGFPKRGEPIVYLLHSWDHTTKTDAIVYVGMSMDVKKRIKTHRKREEKGGLFDGVSFIQCASRVDALGLEADLIFQHKPPLNTQGISNRMMVNK